MGKNPVTVYVKTRPTANFAQDQLVIDQDANRIKVINRNESDRQHTDNKRDTWDFGFHRVLHNAGQETTYQAVASNVVSKFLEGVNGTIMAYGQTGAGKTFTMTGDCANFKQRGVTPRAIGQVFEDIAERSQYEFKVSVSYMEIYNEKVFDLLDSTGGQSSSSDFAVVEDPATRSMHVRGLTQMPVCDEEEALGFLFQGDSQRTTAAHQLNKNSNRSHAIFTIYLEQRSRVRSDNVLRSKLHLVDLAGSERLKKTMEASTKDGKVVEFDPALKKESMYINKSLTYLEQVVIALTGKARSHVPYRQTKLTNILKDSLGGNCSTAFIACIWGESAHLEETVSTLKLAQRMMRVENTASTNVQSNPELLVKRYKRQIAELKQELMMHDTLANRSGISYDEFTAEESAQVAEMVREYVAASPEDEAEVLKLESMKQIREGFLQFKSYFLETVANGGGGGGGATQQAQAQAVQLAPMGDQAFPGENEDDGGESKYGNDHVGDMDEGGGFSLGVAAAGARPEVLEQKYGGGGSGSSVPLKSGLVGEADTEGFGSDGPGEEGGMNTKESRDNQFKQFTDGEGSELHNNFLECMRNIAVLVQDMQHAKSAMKDSQSLIEKTQLMLDDKRTSQNRDDAEGSESKHDMVDEEELNGIGELRLHKKTFRQCHGEYAQLRKRLSASKESRVQLETKLLETFEEWVATAVAAKRQTGGENDDVLDDGECFDKLEIERVMADDPESLAFFKAQKGLKEKNRKQQMNSPNPSRSRRR